jgi:hypothetical protein
MHDTNGILDVRQESQNTMRNELVQRSRESRDSKNQMSYILNMFPSTQIHSNFFMNHTTNLIYRQRILLQCI